MGKGKHLNQKQKSKMLREQAAKYGISSRDYYDDEGNDYSRDRLDRFLGNDLEDGVMQAMRRDPVLLDSIKYGRDAGAKGFEDLPVSISNSGEAARALKAIQNHGKTLGQKKTSSDNDYGNIAQALFESSRNKLMESMRNMKADDEQTNTSLTPDVSDEPYVPSPELVKQAGILADYEEGYGSGNLSPYRSNFQDMAFNPTEANPYRATTDVNEFVSNYKNGVKDVFQFRPTIA